MLSIELERMTNLENKYGIYLHVDQIEHKNGFIESKYYEIKNGRKIYLGDSLDLVEGLYATWEYLKNCVDYKDYDRG